jgi:peptidoglycan hydrolase-like protein with peptidoglycan-binding domain
MERVMRNHVQGLGLLLVLALAIWGTAHFAAPTVGDAFSKNGAVRAESKDSTEEVIDLSSDAELTTDELYNLQWYLTIEGYDTLGLDGLMGPGTRAAIDQAKADYGLPTGASPRDLLEFLTTRQDESADQDESAEGQDLGIVPG